MSKTIKCPICEKKIEINVSNNYRPFCSNRCRLIDLGQWIDETYLIADSNVNVDNFDIEPIANIKH